METFVRNNHEIITQPDPKSKECDNVRPERCRVRLPACRGRRPASSSCLQSQTGVNTNGCVRKDIGLANWFDIIGRWKTPDGEIRKKTTIQKPQSAQRLEVPIRFFFFFFAESNLSKRRETILYVPLFTSAITNRGRIFYYILYLKKLLLPKTEPLVGLYWFSHNTTQTLATFITTF